MKHRSRFRQCRKQNLTASEIVNLLLILYRGIVIVIESFTAVVLEIKKTIYCSVIDIRSYWHRKIMVDDIGGGVWSSEMCGLRGDIDHQLI